VDGMRKPYTSCLDRRNSRGDSHTASHYLFGKTGRTSGRAASPCLRWRRRVSRTGARTSILFKTAAESSGRQARRGKTALHSGMRFVAKHGEPKALKQPARTDANHAAPAAHTRRATAPAVRRAALSSRLSPRVSGKTFRMRQEGRHSRCRASGDSWGLPVLIRLCIWREEVAYCRG